MNGAEDFYNIFQEAYYRNLGDFKELELEYGWYGGNSKTYIYGNIIFITSSHARGKCFHIFLIENPNQSNEEIKSNAFEVYGVISGNPGWTEQYGWIHKGSWVKAILGYINQLEDEINQYDENKIRIEEKERKNNEKETVIKLEKFDKIFQ
jgi:hypothetical protein